VSFLTRAKSRAFDRSALFYCLNSCFSNRQKRTRDVCSPSSAPSFVVLCLRLHNDSHAPIKWQTTYDRHPLDLHSFLWPSLVQYFAVVAEGDEGMVDVTGRSHVCASETGLLLESSSRGQSSVPSRLWWSASPTTGSSPRLSLQQYSTTTKAKDQVRVANARTSSSLPRNMTTEHSTAQTTGPNSKRPAKMASSQSLNHLLNFSLPPRQTHQYNSAPRRRKPGQHQAVWNKEREYMSKLTILHFP
jgi:hypothetical protein